jgi:hypothetical protein
MSPHASWLLVNEIIPRIAAVVPRCVPHIGTEDTEEIVQDASAMAARMLSYAERNGKQVTAGNIAFYTLQHMKSGRRFGGNRTVDVFGTATQLQGHSRLSSFDEAMDANESEADSFTLHHAFTDPSEDPATKAARKMDWETFMAMQDECDRAILQCAAEGEAFGQVGKRFRVSPTTVRNRKRQLAIAVREFMGENILAEAGRQPQWKEQLMARRQKLSPARNSIAS